MAEPRLQLASVWGKGHPSGPGSAPGQAGEAGLARGCPGAGQMGRACSAGWVSGSAPWAPLHTPPGPACARDVCDESPRGGFSSVPGGGARGPGGRPVRTEGLCFLGREGEGPSLTKSHLSVDIPPALSELACPCPGRLVSRAHAPPPWAQARPSLLGQAALSLGTGPRPAAGWLRPRPLGPPEYVLIGTSPTPGGTSWSGPLSRVGAHPWRLSTGLWRIGQTWQR